ncbi:hypothetical protein [Cupriavidus sp. H19C3]|uniref:hypothetical protein n=1 Tax=Cupriavidus sp. H19C3 TaxID=3241603 RepID=UPI003BF7C5ED
MSEGNFWDNAASQIISIFDDANKINLDFRFVDAAMFNNVEGAKSLIESGLKIDKRGVEFLKRSLSNNDAINFLEKFLLNKKLSKHLSPSKTSRAVKI